MNWTPMLSVRRHRDARRCVEPPILGLGRLASERLGEGLVFMLGGKVVPTGRLPAYDNDHSL
jgi:hypothetical protein